MKEKAVERGIELAASPAAVWQALTRGPELSAWFGATVELEARRGGRATFGWPDGRSREARVEVFDPQRQLLLRWLPFERGPGGATTIKPSGQIRFVLEARGERTFLSVTETVVGGEVAMALAGAGRGPS